MRSAAAAIKYFEQTDLLASSPGEWLGKGAEMLGLDGSKNRYGWRQKKTPLAPKHEAG
ncbi:hypothetical protein GobsT_50230 [Gemmata obscuriglobus]|nr:hypothetical protein GobsT_50230 [Gemmata obscuriglobus]VTS09544.1 unnamed protein product [Gemmata obscuriglobus UQM 2246]